MRSFRRLPPFLRVVSVFGLLFPLTSLVLCAAWPVSSITSWFMFLQASGNAERLFVIAGNLTMLGVACTFPISRYNLGVRQADSGGPVLLDAWQRQARALALLGALPLCGIILALIIPPASSIFALAFVASLCGALTVIGASVWLLVRIGEVAPA